MTCRATRSYLVAYTLGELDRRTEQAVTSHLAVCRGCDLHATATRRELAAIHDAVKTDLMAPADTIERLQTRITTVKTPLRWPWKLAPVFAFGLAALAFSFWPKHDAAISETPALTLSQLISMEVPTPKPNMQPVRAILSMKHDTGLAMVQPNLAALGGRYLGGCCLHVKGHHLVALQYKVGSTPMMFVQAPKRTIDLVGAPGVCNKGHHYYVAAERGRAAVSWESGDSRCALIANMDADALTHLAMRLD